MNGMLPPLRSWSENSINQCSFEEIPVYWEANDAVTFLANLGMYNPSLYHVLDNSEKEQEQKFKTDYFKKRFTTSRSLLKYILQPILATENPWVILLSKEKKGRVIIPGRPEICISLSYSGSYIAITLGKQKIGSDIEVIRPVKANKISSSQIFNNYIHTDDREYLQRVIHVWTLMESYAKLYDDNAYSLLNSWSLFNYANFVSYCIDNHLIFSLASGNKQITEVLVWLDSNEIGEVSHLTKTT